VRSGINTELSSIVRGSGKRDPRTDAVTYRFTSRNLMPLGGLRMTVPAKRDHILIVEDDQLLQNFLAMHLELEGPKVETASEGEAGVRILRENRTALIVLDLMMPVLDGMSFMSQLRAEIPAPPPVVVVSGLKQDEVERELLELGVVSIVRKPADPEDILRHIHDARV
jgi:CheY-like chemotaxis protein